MTSKNIIRALISLIIAWLPISPFASGNGPCESHRPGFTIPQRCDLRPYLPPPGKQQSGENNCAAWAAAYGSLTSMLASDRNRKPVCRCEQFSPAFLFLQLRRNENRELVLGTDGSGDTVTGLATAVGGCSLQACPLNQERSDLGALGKIAGYQLEVHFKNLRVERIDKTGRSKKIKKQISRKQIVMANIMFDDGFHAKTGTSGCDEASVYKMTTGADRGWHSVCLVGFDDNLGENGAFLIMNSWGTDWKNGGFCWVDASIIESLGDVCYFKDQDANLPKVRLNEIALQMERDYSITQDEDEHLPITPTGKKYLDLAAAGDTFFALDARQKLWTLSTNQLQDHDCRDGLPAWSPVSIDAEVTMVLGVGKNAFALAGGKVYQYDEASERQWQPLPINATIIGIHRHKKHLRATSDTGTMHQYANEAWKSVSF